MSDLPAVREDLSPENRVIAAVRAPEMREQLEVALPENVNVDRFVRVAVTALREQPDLAKCDPKTVMSAVIRCAQDGLLPDGREAALVKFGTTATYMPMVGGFRKIAAEYGWNISSAAVFSEDHFEYELGEAPRVQHRPPRLGEDRGRLIGAYAVADHVDGRRLVEVMDEADVERARAKARTQNVWNEWTARMYEKTPARRLFQKLPLGDPDRVARVLAAEEALPADAAEQLYGPQARAALESPATATPEGKPAPTLEPGESVTPEATHQERPDRSATAAPTAEQPGAPASEPPFAGDEPVTAEGQPDAGTEAEPSVVEQAGAVVFTHGHHAGQSIADVYALGKAGRKYLQWAAKSWTEEPVKSAVTTWNAHHDDI